jgi:Ca2+-binding RTX toxin-like protein
VEIGAQLDVVSGGRHEPFTVAGNTDAALGVWRDMNRTSILAAASAAAALAAFPAAASAVPTAAVNAANKTTTVTGDGTAENIDITETGGLIALNGSTDLGGATAAADGTFTLTVDGGDGDDTFTVNAAGLSSSVISGGAGNDTLTGGPNNDRIIGNTGADTMIGGNGNDVMVWNPGDGSDVMDGQGGADEAELNGGSNAENFAATQVADRVRFERLSPGAFNLNVGTTEKLVLNGNGGNDTMVSDAAVTTAMLLNGGDGVDNLQGGGGADLINGGDLNDALNGGPGRDRLVGDRGADGMTGAGGDDTMVWNNGDGSDVMEGEDGLDKVEVNGSDGPEVFTIAPNGARAKFDRTNVGPFSLDIGTSELLLLNALGGDDSFTAAPGNPLAVIADGGAGNDGFTGAEEADNFFGGLGNDTLNGGAGPDLLDGQDDNDSLLARDGLGDLVRGGAGTDSAQTDAIDIVDGVESNDTVNSDTSATPIDVTKRKLKIRFDRRNRASVRIPVKCSDAETGGCEGRITLLSRRSFNVAGNRVKLVLGSKPFDLDRGETKRIKVNLPKGIRKLAKKRKIAVNVQSSTRDAAGHLAQASERVTLTIPKKKRK